MNVPVHHQTDPPLKKQALCFVSDSTCDLDDFLEQISLWAEAVIVDRKLEDNQLTLIVELPSENPGDVLRLFKRELQTWPEIQMTTTERGNQND